MKSAFGVVLIGLALAGCATKGTSQQQQAIAAPPPGEPSDLAGLAPANVQALFGAPAFVRKDGQTQMWRYDGQTCRAFFFFYGQVGAQTVRHVETLPRGTTIAADATCLDALRARQPKVS